jgi:hypothetical protein
VAGFNVDGARLKPHHIHALNEYYLRQTHTLTTPYPDNITRPNCG